MPWPEPEWSEKLLCSAAASPMVGASVGPHILTMITFTPNPHMLQVTPSPTEPGRFDWVILRDGVVVRRSIRSFGSEGTSAADGDTALREVTALWRDAK
jgi:hypothetical protein